MFVYETAAVNPQVRSLHIDGKCGHCISTPSVRAVFDFGTVD
jgi:hypothetical protein